MSDEQTFPPIVVLYAVPIQEAARSGDRDRMSKMEAEGQKYVSELESALADLRKAMGSS